MLQLGASKPWPEAMELVTGQPEMDAGALREYFAPLEEWLKAENERTGETIGWDKTDKCEFPYRKRRLRLKNLIPSFICRLREGQRRAGQTQSSDGPTDEGVQQ